MRIPSLIVVITSLALPACTAQDPDDGGSSGGKGGGSTGPKAVAYFHCETYNSSGETYVAALRSLEVIGTELTVGCSRIVSIGAPGDPVFWRISADPATTPTGYTDPGDPGRAVVLHRWYPNVYGVKDGAIYYQGPERELYSYAPGMVEPTKLMTSTPFCYTPTGRCSMSFVADNIFWSHAETNAAEAGLAKATLTTNTSGITGNVPFSMVATVGPTATDGTNIYFEAYDPYGLTDTYLVRAPAAGGPATQVASLQGYWYLDLIDVNGRLFGLRQKMHLGFRDPTFEPMQLVEINKSDGAEALISEVSPQSWSPSGSAMLRSDGEHLYWPDQGTPNVTAAGSIKAYNLTSGQITNVIEHRNVPTDIALASGRLFWIELGALPGDTTPVGRSWAVMTAPR